MKALADSPEAPSRAGAPSRIAPPSVSTQAWTETMAPADGGRGVATREPINASSDCASRHPSTTNDANLDRLRSPATPAAHVIAELQAADRLLKLMPALGHWNLITCASALVISTIPVIVVCIGNASAI